MNKKRWFAIWCFLLVFLFFYTALSKILSFKDFQFDMKNQPFPNSWAPYFAYGLPTAELAIVACLVFNRSRLFGLYASMVLMLLFAVYTSLVLAHVFPYTPCSCGGIIRSLSWPQHLVFNLFFVAISFWSIRNYKEALLPETSNLNQFI